MKNLRIRSAVKAFMEISSMIRIIPSTPLTLATILAYSALTGSLLTGCGRMTDPVPPEVLAPRPVTELTVTTGLDGVRLAWKGESNDLRGKQLNDSDGYLIRRKILTTPADIEDDEVEFIDIGTVADAHIAELVSKQELARAEKKPVHRVRVESDLKSYTFLDSEVEPGVQYFYIVVPLNQGGVKGGVDLAAIVSFRGDSSDVVLQPYVPVGSVLASKAASDSPLTIMGK